MNMQEALREFEKAERNLKKLERVWSQLRNLTPWASTRHIDLAPEDRLRYHQLTLAFRAISQGLPVIHGQKSLSQPEPLGVLYSNWHDIVTSGSPEAEAELLSRMLQPGEDLIAYGELLRSAHQKYISPRLGRLLYACDQSSDELSHMTLTPHSPADLDLAETEAWHTLTLSLEEIGKLLGNILENDELWWRLQKHVRFADVKEVINSDWPRARRALEDSIYTWADPVPALQMDLGTLAPVLPTSTLQSRVDWSKLSAGDFERLVFALLDGVPGYESTELLLHANAADHGRDVAVTRVSEDCLTGPHRSYLVIQCKHWKSTIGQTELSNLLTSVKLLEKQPDVLVLATTSTFSEDAVQYRDKHNQGRDRPTLEFWPESKLRSMLSKRPELLSEFGLRSPSSQ